MSFTYTPNRLGYVLIALCCLLPSSWAFSMTVNIASLTPTDNLALKMLVLDADLPSIDQAKKAEGWVVATQSNLAAPRQNSTIWLKVKLQNTLSLSHSPAQYLHRWLEISPWRLGRVEAWFFSSQSKTTKKDTLLQYYVTGLSIPKEKRPLARYNQVSAVDSPQPDSIHPLLPINMAYGEEIDLYLRVSSDSRPFLKISSWDPIDFVHQKIQGQLHHQALLAAICTLFIVLLLQLNFKLTLLGIWLLVTFTFESEKNGFFSLFLFQALSDYSLQLRFFTWILTGTLFLTVSIFLLGMQQQKLWRYVLVGIFSVSAVFGLMSFFLDGVLLRKTGIFIDISYSVIWLLLVPASLRIKNDFQHTLLVILSTWWLVANIILVGYITNWYYTAALAEGKIIVEIGIILSLLVVYTLQVKKHKETIERQLRSKEREEKGHLEAAVQEKTSELEKALKMAHQANDDKTRLLTHISHDLRSPLTSIMGYTQLLQSQPEKSGEIIQIIYTSTIYMNNLINRIIDYSKADDVATEYSDAYIYSLLDGICNNSKMLCEKNKNHLVADFSPNLFPVVRINEIPLRQILLNLLDNAAKYTSNGRIDFSVHVIESTHNRQHVEFTIKDNGCGIPNRIRKQLFSPFVRGNKNNDGFGLGLAIVRDLVKQLKGRIILESVEGEGTSISVLLAIDKGDENELISGITPAPNDALPYYDANEQPVWLIEDSAKIRELLKHELEDMGFIVESFASAEAFIIMLEGNTEHLPSLVITDHHLPGLSGDAIRDAIKARSPEIPIVLLSATSQAFRSKLGSKSETKGYEAYLTKPVDLAVFRQKIADICGLTSE